MFEAYGTDAELKAAAKFADQVIAKGSAKRSDRDRLMSRHLADHASEETRLERARRGATAMAAYLIENGHVDRADGIAVMDRLIEAAEDDVRAPRTVAFFSGGEERRGSRFHRISEQLFGRVDDNPPSDVDRARERAERFAEERIARLERRSAEPDDDMDDEPAPVRTRTEPRPLRSQGVAVFDDKTKADVAAAKRRAEEYAKKRNGRLKPKPNPYLTPKPAQPESKRASVQFSDVLDDPHMTATLSCDR